MIYHTTTKGKGKTCYRYWTSSCGTCKIRAQCTTGKERRVTKWEYEEVLDTVQDRLDRDPDRIHARRNTVEHRFGTIKSWMGYTHFQMRTLHNVRTEMSLYVLAYNIKRVIQIMGIGPLMQVLRA